MKDEVRFYNIRESLGGLGVSVEDIAYIDQVITKEKEEKIENVGSVRIGIPKEGLFADLAPAVENAAQKSIQKLREFGFILVEDDSIQDLVSLNHLVSLYTAFYEMPNKKDEFYRKYNINLNYEEALE